MKPTRKRYFHPKRSLSKAQAETLSKTLIALGVEAIIARERGHRQSARRYARLSRALLDAFCERLTAAESNARTAARIDAWIARAEARTAVRLGGKKQRRKHKAPAATRRDRESRLTSSPSGEE